MKITGYDIIIADDSF